MTTPYGSDFQVCSRPPEDTYAEAIARLKTYRDTKRFRLTATRRSLDDALRMDAPGSKAMESARMAHAIADSEWQSTSQQIAMLEAFVRAHPFLANRGMFTTCNHERTGQWASCYVGPDCGWYVSPTREPGGDDDA